MCFSENCLVRKKRVNFGKPKVDGKKIVKMLLKLCTHYSLELKLSSEKIKTLFYAGYFTGNIMVDCYFPFDLSKR